MLSLSVDIWRPVVSGGSQSLTAQVQALFANGERGFYFSANNAQYLYQDTGEASPVTTTGQSVARSKDASPNNVKFNWSNATAILDSLGLWSVRCNGSSSIATTIAALDFSGATKATAIFALRQRVYDTNAVVLLEHAAPPWVGTGGIGAYGNNGAPAGGFGGGEGTSSNYVYCNSTNGAGFERVVIVQIDYDPSQASSADKVAIHINGAAASQSAIVVSGSPDTTMFRSGNVTLAARSAGVLSADVDLFAVLYIDRALTLAETNTAYSVLSAQCKPTQELTTGFWDSIAATNATNYYLTSCCAQTVFTTSETLLELSVYNNIYGDFPGYANLAVFVNGVYNQLISPGVYGATKHLITLPAGAKTVAVVNGLQSKPAATVIGTFLVAVRSLSGVTLTTQTPVNRLLIYGDSITVGANSTSPQVDSWAMKVRAANLPNSTMLDAWGYRSLWDDAVDATARTAFAARWAALSPSKIWLAIGTNDYGLNKWSAASFGAAYADLLDKLHAAIPSATIYCQTPILRSSEVANGSGSTLGDYRTQIATAQSTRSSYTVLVDGTAFMTTASLDDGLHPGDAGHTLYANGVRTALGI